MDNSNKVTQLQDSVENLSIKDITSVINRATEMFSKGEVNEERYNKILISIAKKAEEIASSIYQKNRTSGKLNNLDLEEYRTLLDISRECRDGVREVTLLGKIKKEPSKSTKSS